MYKKCVDISTRNLIICCLFYLFTFVLKLNFLFKNNVRNSLQNRVYYVITEKSLLQWYDVEKCSAPVLSNIVPHLANDVNFNWKCRLISFLLVHFNCINVTIKHLEDLVKVMMVEMYMEIKMDVLKCIPWN